MNEDISPGFNWLKTVAVKEMWCLDASELKIKEPFRLDDRGFRYLQVTWRGLTCIGKELIVSKSSDSIIGDDITTKTINNQKVVETTSVSTSGSNKSQLKAFETEISILSSLRHPNLLMFFGACFYDLKPPLVLLEYCPKGSLEDKISQCKSQKTKLKSSEKRRHIFEIALGLNFLHCCAEPIIHGRLQPSNIYLDQDNRIKLSEFESGSTVKDTVASTRFSSTDLWRYVAPELLQKLSFTSSVDIYSFALVVYYLMTFMKPFEGFGYSKELLNSISKQGERPSINMIKNQTIRELIQKCWDSTPSNRPAFPEIVGLLESQISENTTCFIS